MSEMYFSFEKVTALALTCPHCKTYVSPHLLTGDDRGELPAGDPVGRLTLGACENCKQGFLMRSVGDGGADQARLIFPTETRPPAPREVGEEDPVMASDWSEACATLPISPQASAALSRRMLQRVLETKCQAPSGARLVDQIKHARKSAPTYLSDAWDALREFGNFAAHPQTDVDTGDVVPVEFGEAEFMLDVVERMFEHYYVGPARTRQKIDEMNEKRERVGKKPLASS